MQSFTAMQQICTHSQGDCFLLSSEQGRGEGENAEEGEVEEVNNEEEEEEDEITTTIQSSA